MTVWPQVFIIAIVAANISFAFTKYVTTEKGTDLAGSIIGNAIFQYLLYAGGFYAALGFAP